MVGWPALGFLSTRLEIELALGEGAILWGSLTGSKVGLCAVVILEDVMWLRVLSLFKSS